MLLAAGALLVLVLASGSFVSVLARLMPPTAVILVMLACSLRPPLRGRQRLLMRDPGGRRRLQPLVHELRGESRRGASPPRRGSGAAGCQVTRSLARGAAVPRVQRGSGRDHASRRDRCRIGIDRTPPQVTALRAGAASGLQRLVQPSGWTQVQGLRCAIGRRVVHRDDVSGPEGAGALVGWDLHGRRGEHGRRLVATQLRRDCAAQARRWRRCRATTRWSSNGRVPNAVAEVTRFHGGETLVSIGAGATPTPTPGSRTRSATDTSSRSSTRPGIVPRARPARFPRRRRCSRRRPARGSRRPHFSLGARSSGRVTTTSSFFRGKRKVLSRWPRTNELQLKRRWRFAGKSRRLVAGRYCWYVWPGLRPAREAQLRTRCSASAASPSPGKIG